MKLSDSGINKYRAYILYGGNIENILRRVVNFVNNCSNIIADDILMEFLKNLCIEKPLLVKIESYNNIDEILSKADEGKAVVFMVESPREDIYAIALIPVDKFNKTVAKGA